MDDCMPPVGGGDDFLSYSQPLRAGNGTSGGRRHARPWARRAGSGAGFPSASKDDSRAATARWGDSHAILVTLLWLGAFAVAEYVFTLPGLLPTVPGTDLRLISLPIALLATALMLRPADEAPAYALVYVFVGVGFALHSPHLDFAVARVGIDTAQTLIAVGLLFRFFYHRFDDTLMVATWAMTVLLVTAAGAALLLFAAAVLPLSAADYARELAGDPRLAWR